MSIWSMASEHRNKDLAEKLEQLLNETEKYEDSSARKEIQDKILPAYEKAVKDSNGMYDQDTYHAIMRRVSKDDWTY